MGEKIKEGTVGSQVSPRLIRSEKFDEGWREKRFEGGGGWPRETFIFQRSGRSSIYMIKFHLIRFPFSSKLYRLPEEVGVERNKGGNKDARDGPLCSIQCYRDLRGNNDRDVIKGRSSCATRKFRSLSKWSSPIFNVSNNRERTVAVEKILLVFRGISSLESCLRYLILNV